MKKKKKREEIDLDQKQEKGQASSGMLSCVPCILLGRWSSDSPGVSCSRGRRQGSTETGPMAGVPSRSISYSAPSLDKLSRGLQLPFGPSVISDVPRGVLAREPHGRNLAPSQGRAGLRAEKESRTWGKGLGVRTVVEEVVSGGRTGLP